MILKPTNDQTAAISKGALMHSLKLQIDGIEGDLKKNFTTVNENTVDTFEKRLEQFHNSEMLGNLNELRKADPTFKLDDADGNDDESSTMNGGTARDRGEKAFWEEMKSAGFQFGTRCLKGNPASGRWARALKADSKLRDRYLQKKGFADKDAFRQEWLKGEFKKWSSRVGYTSLEENRKEISKDGSYLTLARVAWKEGPGVNGLRSAIRYCTRCMLLQSHWVKYCDMRQTLLFFYVVEKVSDKQIKAWRKFQKWTNNEGSAASSSSSSTPADSAPGSTPTTRASTEKKDVSLSEPTPEKDVTPKRSDVEEEEEEPKGEDGDDPQPKPGEHDPKPKAKTPEWMTKFKQVPMGCSTDRFRGRFVK